MQDGRLDPELADKLWHYHVGYDFHAGENTFYAFRHAVIRHGRSSETDKEVAASRRVLVLAASRRVLDLDSRPGGKGGREFTISGEHDDSGDGESEHDDSGEESVDGSDSADETASGGKNARDPVCRYTPIQLLQCYDPLCRGPVRLSTSRCTVS